MASLIIVPTFENLPSSSSSCKCDLGSTRHGPIRQRALFRRRWSPFETSHLSRFLDLTEDERDFADHTEGLENLWRFPSLLFHLRDRRSAKEKSHSATNKSAKTDKKASEKTDQKLAQEHERSDKFSISVELGNAFEPSEISVKVIGQSLKIEGKHEETGDEGHFASRQFIRSFYLPDDVDIENLTSAFSKEGVLSVEAPRLQLKEKEPEERNIPIQQATFPEVGEEQKSEESKKDEEEKTNSEEEDKEMETTENEPSQPKQAGDSSKN